ncbi:MAG: radical SAM protein [Pseudomonadales bacterium]|nr:radical SAM protein [Pseudomonadales bacterium]
MAEKIPVTRLDDPASTRSASDALGEGNDLLLDSIHDFANKLTQTGAREALQRYVDWQVAQRNAEDVDAVELDPSQVPDFAPVSINLDLTTACNYQCDHCVDLDILNTGVRYDHDKLLSSLALMAERGLKSVIVIGGGEPTLYPKFGETIRFMKSLGLQIAIVSNGTGNLKIAEVADCMDKNDWVRLSLDSGSDETFQAMHNPRKSFSLYDICAAVPKIRAANPDLTVGFSYIVTWRGANINDRDIVENLHEIAQATQLARDSQFSYISFKPFLTRDEVNNAEVIGINEQTHKEAIVSAIQQQVDDAVIMATSDFKVHRSTGLKALLEGQIQKLEKQPQQCHMQFFRQVLSPLGLYNCPVYRNQPHGKLGDKNAVSDTQAYEATRGVAANLIRDFNATTNCEKVTCLYNDVNWWIEGLIQNPDAMATLSDNNTDPDYFL